MTQPFVSAKQPLKHNQAKGPKWADKAAFYAILGAILQITYFTDVY